MKVAIVNYGMGNLNSVRRAFSDVGAEVIIANRPSDLYEASRIVLPGVGAFSEGMACLRSAGWDVALHEAVLLQHKPLLGICLGMQMLATLGNEGGETAGLGFVPGEVNRLDVLGCEYRIPHVGWNEVGYKSNDYLFNKIPNFSDFYFVHSYAFVPTESKNLIASAPYDLEVVAAIRKDHIFGCQFHPEKSSKAGRQLLKNFMSYALC